jgi:tetraacyldisaccharide 4'-kinase
MLTPVGWIYGATVAWKARHAHPYRSSAKVVCVGNLSAGGTGKTPITAVIAQAFEKRRHRTVILSRGYGGKMQGPAFVDLAHDTFEETGDEALLLAGTASVIVARDRAAGAKFAERDGAQIIVMDDGFQNFTLEKDFSIVVVDAQTGFGNGRIIPAGSLRENIAQGLARADAVILVGDGTPALPGFSGPVLRARLVPKDVTGVSGARVLAFAGIGRPEKFFETLRSLGAQIVEAREYDDHYAYTASEFARLRAKAKAAGAQLITTEKDFVRLTPAERQDVHFVPVQAAFDDPAALDALLDSIAPRTS